MYTYNYFLYCSNNHNKMKYRQKVKYKSPAKRLTSVCKTISLLRFPISVVIDPDVNYMYFSLNKYT